MSDDVRERFERWCSLNCVIASPSRWEVWQAAQAEAAAQIKDLSEKLARERAVSDVYRKAAHDIAGVTESEVSETSSLVDELELALQHYSKLPYGGNAEAVQAITKLQAWRGNDSGN